MSKPYIPHVLPIEDLDWKRLIEPVAQANSEISRYDGLLQSIINPDIFLAPMTTREAVLSSRIEGTQASLSDVLEHEAGQEYDADKTIDIKEIRNYRIALVEAEKELAHRPISLNLIKMLHKTLMDSVRGQDALPGQFRVEQNWIGAKNCTQAQARFVPPNPMILQEYLEKWEDYLQKKQGEALVKLAIIHAQFEILHPFKDGNGRMGRILIPLYLYQRNILHRPTFYLSEFLESRRDLYYDKLLWITKHNDWQGWIEFFLDAIYQQSGANTTKAKTMLLLYENAKKAFTEVTHSQYAVAALDSLFAKPIINATDFKRRSAIPTAVTSNNILKQLSDAGYLMLLKKSSGRKAAVFCFPELFNIAEGQKVFSVNKTILI